jgi:7,8-dihydropterin-6-yl-methyl-4-(beta-D-ribofuranosyl)aminobenzene 5'-phosphate synthase
MVTTNHGKRMGKRTTSKVLLTVTLFIMVFFMCTRDVKASSLRIKVIFDNVPYTEQLKTAWGFSCIIERISQVILFDTGSDGNILLSNMEKMGIDPRDIDVVFLSHIHGDHTGGLSAFLQKNPNVIVFLPASFPPSFQDSITGLGSKFKTLEKPEKLFGQVYTTGELGSRIKEQSLIIDTPKGLVIVTGCAHPGIVQIVSQAQNWLQKKVYLLVGGFHLEGQPQRGLQRIADELKKLGVEKVAPSHCTGDAARNLFRDLWGQNFVESGLGAIIELQP